MQYKFIAYGHENITAKHKTTLEFTKDEDLSLKGDCIIGVRADFSLNQLKKFIKSLKNNKIKIRIEINIKKLPLLKKSLNGKSIKSLKNNKKIIEVIHAEINPDFNSDREMVIRKSEFKDKRTFAVRADKAACDLSRKLTIKLKNFKQKMTISISIVKNSKI